MSLVFVLGLLLCASSIQAQASPGGQWRQDIRAYAQNLVDAGLSPGLSVAVVTGDRVADGFGVGLADMETNMPVDAGTRFYIASSSKALTATAVVLMAAEGRIDLQAPVTRYLPTLRFGEGIDANDVTVHDLLAMTDGVSDAWPAVLRTAYSGEFTVPLLIDLFADYGASEEGRAFDYSNLPYNLLGLVIDAVDDGEMAPDGWKTVVRSRVLDPLSMHEVTARPSTLEADRIAMPHVLNGEGRFERVRLAKADANLHAAGGHFASARSLARFVAMHIGLGQLEGQAIFDPEVIAATHAEQARQDSQDFEYQRDGWGYGWDRALWGDERILQRFGGFTGYFSHMSFLPERGLGVVVLSNGRTRTPAAELLAGYIYARLLEHENLDAHYAEALEAAREETAVLGQRIAQSLAERAERLAPLPRPLSAYTGRFHNPAMGTMQWQAVAGGLEVWMGIAHARAEIFDAPQEQFRLTLTGGGSVAGFEFDEDGNVERLRWNGQDFLPIGGDH
ncbi:serine hydrolase [Wenzhouxiangella marina]|nr:serine hydrolase [Wenzhouxiangella marina]MBB6087273.1 CubicO group peptidase (beta-lactamase class C family) [Wenzhouxiangella marina]